MRSRLNPSWAFLALITGGCLGATGARDSAGGSGKEDNPQDHVDASLCELPSTAATTIVREVTADQVVLRCHGPDDAVVETGCCFDGLGEFWFATGCPLQATFERVEDPTDDSGWRHRCIANDPVGDDETLGAIELVATVCCEPLCDGARWTNADQSGGCRTADGESRPDACCAMTDADRCGDARWEAREVDDGQARCWAQTGPLADHYAPAACCISSCLDQTLGDDELNALQTLPIECRLPVDNECAATEVNAHGACVRVLDDDARELVGEQLGTYAKAACCAGQDGLHLELADTCHRDELRGESLSRCAPPR